MKTYMRHLPAAFVFVFLCALPICSNATSQTISGSHRCAREAREVGSILCMLSADTLDCAPRHSCHTAYLDSVLKYFYGDVYDDELPDLVVFVDRRNQSNAQDNNRIALLKGCKRTNQLFGERFIHVAIFVAEDSADRAGVTKLDTSHKRLERQTSYGTMEGGSGVVVDSVIRESTEITGNPVTIKLSPLDQRAGSGELALIGAMKMIAEVFSGQSVAGRGERISPADTVVSPERLDVGCYNGTCLYFWQGKLPLAENTINRIKVERIPGRRSFATFGNYSGSWITSSIGVTGTFLDSETATDDSVHSTLVEPFIFGHLYVKRPQRPRPRLNDPWKEFKRGISFSLVVGTRLSTSDFFRDWFLGVGLGHFLSTASVVAGVNFRTSKHTGDRGEKRKGHFACGITFMF